MVGLQTSTAKARRVATGTARQFNEQLAGFFNGWEGFARGLSWEIIYVQRADSVTVHACQDCGNAGDRASAGDERHRTFWGNEVHQHHVAMPHEDAIAVCSECSGFMFSLCLSCGASLPRAPRRGWGAGGCVWGGGGGGATALLRFGFFDLFFLFLFFLLFLRRAALLLHCAEGSRAGAGRVAVGPATARSCGHVRCVSPPEGLKGGA
ncbi:putative retrotransposon hot spot (RHS) protein [Trypanosoma conorhini]|uniref:Putative retrotransposon hot spot (RHS) protein n=1 Tax=Trypanosoma conorhini TaxID=83891 RepID=A0A422MPJ0_9TRYP|nr:putative retrotransposon hot spot (RHS) protein [Trypanosoma conorhini]RNE95131.1 putative retrotransposon hot spot (RHS) protein [Trypanosoma conorhini]